MHKGLLKVGITHSAQGQLAEAECIFLQLINQHPPLPDALHQLGLIRLRQGRQQEAVLLIQQAVDVGNPSVDMLLNLGFALNCSGDHRAAVRVLQRAREVDPQDPDLLLNLGNAFLGLQQLSEAICAFRHALFLVPHDIRYRCNLAHALSLDGKLTDALIAIEEGGTESDQSFEAALLRTAIYLGLGQPKQAERWAKQAAEFQPNSVKAITNLGHVRWAYGANDDALRLFQSAYASERTFETAFNLSRALYLVGEYEAGLEILSEATSKLTDPPADAFSLRVLILCARGEFHEAHRVLDDACLCWPEASFCLSSRAFIYLREGKYEAAIEACRSARSIDPTSVEAIVNQGAAHLALRDLDNAVNCLEEAYASSQTNDVCANLARAYQATNRYKDALELLTIAARDNPPSAEILSLLGFGYRKLGYAPLAIEHYEGALAVTPMYEDAVCGLADLKRLSGHWDEAISLLRRLTQASPPSGRLLLTLSTCLRDAGQHLEALEVLEPALSEHHNDHFLLGAYASLCLDLCCWTKLNEVRTLIKSRIEEGGLPANPFDTLLLFDDPKMQLKIATRYSDFSFPKYAYVNQDTPSSAPNRKLRIGYFSADFRKHPVGFLIQALLSGHNRDEFEVHCFYYGPPTQDSLNLKIIESSDFFHSVSEMSGEEIARKARGIGIDVAVDLGGHTKHARTEIFAHRASPIQVNYLGYPGTMGTSFHDFVVSDASLTEEDDACYYSESVLRVEPCYQPNIAIDRRPLTNLNKEDFLDKKLQDEDTFIFCCFNNHNKITPAVFSAWMRILARIPNSVLWLYVQNETARKNLCVESRSHGINPERLIFATTVNHETHLRRLSFANLFLDTYPYNAHTTASDSLRVGVPIITLRGASFHSRVASSLLRTINLPELIVTDLSDYEDLAVRLASCKEDLDSLRLKLKYNVEKSVLFDPIQYSRAFEQQVMTIVGRHFQTN